MTKHLLDSQNVLRARNSVQSQNIKMSAYNKLILWHLKLKRFSDFPFFGCEKTVPDASEKKAILSGIVRKEKLNLSENSRIIVEYS